MGHRYEKENAKLAGALKQQQHDAARSHSDLRTENTRLQQQVATLQMKLRRAGNGNNGNNNNNNNSNSNTSVAPDATQVPSSEGSSSSGGDGATSTSNGGGGRGEVAPQLPSPTHVTANTGASVGPGDVSYSHLLRQSLTRDQEFRDVQNTLLEERERHTEQVGCVLVDYCVYRHSSSLVVIMSP